MRLDLVIVISALFLPISSCFSQTITFYLGIDGLTCSQCTRSVEMQLKKLDFIKSVEMQLAQTRAVIQVNEASIISPDAITKAVRNAGYSVRHLKVTLPSAVLKSCLLVNGFDGALSLQSMNGNSSDPKVNSIVFLGSSFQSKKEFKGTKEKLINQCPENKGKVYFAKVE